MWKEAIVAKFVALSRNLPRTTEENHVKNDLEWSSPGLYRESNRNKIIIPSYQGPQYLQLAAVFSLYISWHKPVFERNNLISSLPCVLPRPQALHTRVSDVRYTGSFSFCTMAAAHTSLYIAGRSIKAANGTCSCWDKIFRIILSVQVEEWWTGFTCDILIQLLSNCGPWTVAGRTINTVS